MGRDVGTIFVLSCLILIKHLRLQINHLSTALISFLLLPNLVRAARLHGSTSRLVVVTSEMSFLGKFDDDVLAQPQILSTLGSQTYCTPKVMGDRYSTSKRELSYLSFFTCCRLTLSRSPKRSVHPRILPAPFTHCRSCSRANVC